MVDVMLVLLIVFMVSAPLLTVGVPIDLPQTQAKSLDQDKEPLAISVNNDGKVFPAEHRNPDRRTGRQAQGGHRGARRFRRAHLCARRQEGRLRHGDAGDGAAVGGGLSPRGAGDGGRAGLVSDALMQFGTTISTVGHVALLAWGLVSFGAKPFDAVQVESMPVDIITSKDFSQITSGVKTAPKAETPKPLVEKVGEVKPVEDVDGQDFRQAGNQVGRRRSRRRRRRRKRRRSPPRREEEREAAGSDRRSAQG